MATIFLKVASDYLSERNQPDTITAHWQFLNRTEAGDAVLVIEDAKMGRGQSVLHMTLYQDNLSSEAPWISPKSNKAITAYITNGLFESETGVTLPTQWELAFPPPPADLTKLPTGEDPYWKKMHVPLMDRLPSFRNIEYYLQKSGHPLPTTHDFWIRLANGEPFKTSSLAYVADAGPPLMVESYRPATADAPLLDSGVPFDKGFWYPTVTMNLDVKKRLRPEGEEWLRLRTVAKMIKNGRYDAEVMIFDAEGELVALSHHVAMALDVSRNTAKRTSKV